MGKREDETKLYQLMAERDAALYQYERLAERLADAEAVIDGYYHPEWYRAKYPRQEATP